MHALHQNPASVSLWSTCEPPLLSRSSDAREGDHRSGICCFIFIAWIFDNPMSSITLRLREIINRPDSVDRSQDRMELDGATAPSLLVYDAELATGILKSDVLVPYNLIALWKQVARLSSSEIGALEAYFLKTPLFLSGEEHKLARKSLVDPYRRIERSLEGWLQDFTQDFFDRHSPEDFDDAAAFVMAYLNGVFQQMLATDLGCSADELPLISTGVLRLIPRPEALRSLNRQLDELVASIKSILQAAGRDPEEAWPLVSVVVMGREPLLGVLLSGLANPSADGEAWDAETLIHQVAPISVLSRQVLEDVALEGLQLKKGQSVTVCPFLAHERAESGVPENRPARRLEFGFGRHLCSGRALSIKIADSFFRNLTPALRRRIDTTNMKLVRDFFLMPK